MYDAHQACIFSDASGLFWVLHAKPSLINQSNNNDTGCLITSFKIRNWTNLTGQIIPGRLVCMCRPSTILMLLLYFIKLLKKFSVIFLWINSNITRSGEKEEESRKYNYLVTAECDFFFFCFKINSMHYRWVFVFSGLVQSEKKQQQKNLQITSFFWDMSFPVSVLEIILHYSGF